MENYGTDVPVCFSERDSTRLGKIHLQRTLNCKYTAVKVRWHTHRNQISSFGEMDKSM
jgi:hypothetical protein